MIVEDEEVDLDILVKQIELVAELAAGGGRCLHEYEKDLLQGVWYLLGHIRDTMDPVDLTTDR